MLGRCVVRVGGANGEVSGDKRRCHLIAGARLHRAVTWAYNTSVDRLHCAS